MAALPIVQAAIAAVLFELLPAPAPSTQSLLAAAPAVQEQSSATPSVSDPRKENVAVIVDEDGNAMIRLLLPFDAPKLPGAPEDGSALGGEPLGDALMQAVALAARQSFTWSGGTDDRTVALAEEIPLSGKHRGRWAFHAGSQPAVGLPGGWGEMLVYGRDPGAEVDAGFLIYGERGGTQVLGYRSIPYRSLVSSHDTDALKAEESTPSFTNALRALPSGDDDTPPLVRALRLAEEVVQREGFVFEDRMQAGVPSEFDEPGTVDLGWEGHLRKGAPTNVTIVADQTDTMAFFFDPSTTAPEYCVANAIVLVHSDGAVTYAGVRAPAGNGGTKPAQTEGAQSVASLADILLHAWRALDEDDAYEGSWLSVVDVIRVDRRPGRLCESVATFINRSSARVLLCVVIEASGETIVYYP